MKEIKEIIKAFHKAEEAGKKTALATVVHVEGSSYRRPGARMLVTEDGEITGAISGGCLEGDALRKAMLAISQNENRLVTYDITDEDDAMPGVQLGCNGIVHILFEPINAKKKINALYLLQQLFNKRKDAVLVTIFSFHNSLQTGTCLLYRNDALFSSLPNDMEETIISDVQQVFQQKKSQLKIYNYDDTVLNAFTEFTEPPVSLVIAGAGNDAQPLVEIASVLGWQITVVDGRPTHAIAQRFKKADTVIVSNADKVLSHIETDAQTVFVLMTHNYHYDLILLSQLITTHSKYIGVLGPKKKLERMFDDLNSNGISLNGNQRSRIYGPVGLDIGAETSEEIALSIAAEIKAVLAIKTAASLKKKEQPIHSRIST